MARGGIPHARFTDGPPPPWARGASVGTLLRPPVAPSPTDKLLDAFARLPVTKNLVAHVQRGARCKAGGLWGASTALLLTTLRKRYDGTLLVLTADDVDSLQLQTDLAAFGCPSHVLPREEQGDDDEPDAQTRSERQRALQHFAADGATLLCGIEAMLQPVATEQARATCSKSVQTEARFPLSGFITQDPALRVPEHPAPDSALDLLTRSDCITTTSPSRPPHPTRCPNLACTPYKPTPRGHRAPGRSPSNDW